MIWVCRNLHELWLLITMTNKKSLPSRVSASTFSLFIKMKKVLENLRHNKIEFFYRHKLFVLTKII